MLLLSGQRGQTLHLLDIRNMTVSDLTVSFRIADPLKTSRPGHHLSELVFTVYPTDKRVCVVTTIVDYLDHTRALRDPLRLPVRATIISTVGWSWETTFTRFYNRPFSTLQHFSRAILS